MRFLLLLFGAALFLECAFGKISSEIETSEIFPVGIKVSKKNEAFIKGHSQNSCFQHFGGSNLLNPNLKIAHRARSAVGASSHVVDGRSINTPLEPLGNMILVKPREPAEKTSGGLLLPSVGLQQQIVGCVVATGKGEINSLNGQRMNISTKVGDWVIFARNDYQEVKYDGERHGFVPYESIFAIINDSVDGKTLPENIVPLRDSIFVRILPPENVTPGGLLLSTAEKSSNFLDGVVISIGEGKKDNNGKFIPLEIKPGDTIRFSSYAIGESEIKLGQSRFAFVKIADAIAKWA